MIIRISAKKGEIAKTVLLPGDPLRAKFIADTYLSDVVCYNEIRGMYGFTGNYKGKKISVQGTGMGVPSISIYVNELIESYGVETLMRVGTCGSIQEDVKIRDVILAMSSSTDSAINKIRFEGQDYAPTADFGLLYRAYEKAKEKGIIAKVGNVFTSDNFYHDNPDYWRKWADFGVLAIEMETAALYSIAAKYKKKALTLLTVSDNILTDEHTTSQERQETFLNMIEIALDIAE